MQSPDPVFSDSNDVDVQLRALDLSVASIHRALTGGVDGMLRTTALNPVNSAGFYMWSETNASFAETVLGRGWTKTDEKNLPIYTNPHGERIIVTSGDEAVGDYLRDPDVRNPKGPATHESVVPNAQLPLFNSRLGLPAILESNENSLWMLLYSVQGSAVAAEVSLPRSMSQNGKVDRWGPRIIVPSLSFERSRFDDDDDFGDTADIPVVPRH